MGDFDEYEKRFRWSKKKSVLSISRNPDCNLATIYPNHNHLPLPSEESSSIDPTDIIGSIEEAKKLEKAGDFVVAGGTGGAAGSFVPNQESIKNLKILFPISKNKGIMMKM